MAFNIVAGLKALVAEAEKDAQESQGGQEPLAQQQVAPVVNSAPPVNQETPAPQAGSSAETQAPVSQGTPQVPSLTYNNDPAVMQELATLRAMQAGRELVPGGSNAPLPLKPQNKVPTFEEFEAMPNEEVAKMTDHEINQVFAGQDWNTLRTG